MIRIIDILQQIDFDNKPALEAEDITGEAQDMTENLSGGRNIATSSRNENDRDINLNTDDLLGVKRDPNGGVVGLDDDDPEAQQDNTNNPPDDNDKEENSDDFNMDNNVGDEPPEDNSLDEEPKENDEFEKNRKRKLWYNFKSLYETLANSIELITKYVPHISDAATIKTMDDIKDNLIESKEQAFKIMTIDYQDISYSQMMKKYIAINNIYDIITQELDTYFVKYREEK